MKPVAGGSGVNTATHLGALIQDFPFSLPNRNEANTETEAAKEQQEEEEQMDVTLQTVVNENDNYGRILINHAKKNNFEIINCRRKPKSNDSNSKQEEKDADGNNNVEDEAEEDISPSTGHCIVLVTKNERSFITHLGIIESFHPAHTMLHELVQCRSANPTFTNHHHHIHIAGYYNLPNFHTKKALKKRIKLIREKRRTQSHGPHVYTTTISLTPQYDATEKWNSLELFDLLPLVDFLILNLMEACQICKVKLSEEEELNHGGTAVNRSVILTQLADIFDIQSPQTYVVVTLGKFGAVLLYGGEIVHTQNAPVGYDNPIDTTGAGDAFVSGFLFGIMNWRRERQHNQVYEIGSVLEEAGGWNEAIEVGMKWGCVTGTACVMKAGASVPSSKNEIDSLIKPNESYEVISEGDGEGYYGESSYDEEESDDDDYDDYDSALDSDFSPGDDEDSEYVSSDADGDYYEAEEEDEKDRK